MRCVPIFCYGFPLKGMRADNRFHEDSLGVIRSLGRAVSLRPKNPLPHGLIETAESFSKQNVHFRSRGLIETAVTDPAISLKPQAGTDLAVSMKPREPIPCSH
jgi:hypothetical protein